MNIQITYHGETLNAYLAKPQIPNGAAILVCHAWWGLNDFFTNLCDRLAEQGYLTLAPDFYHGAVASQIEDAKKLRAKIDRKILNKELLAATDYLVTHKDITQNKIGVLGVSLGTQWAFWLSNNRPQHIAAVVAYYGVGSGNFAKTQAAYLGHFAENDKWGVTEKKVQKLREKLENQGCTVIFHTYPGTEHWFFEADQPYYDHKAASIAWQRTLDFLEKTLIV